MKAFIDIFPVLVFFIAYWLNGIFAATFATIIATIMQVLYIYFKEKKVEKMSIVTLVMVLVFGGATIYLQNETYIQYKPTAVYWIFATAFIASELFTKKPLAKTVMGNQIKLKDEKIWKVISRAWFVFFTIMGFVNIYVVKNYTMDFWVNFKLFGSLAFTFTFVIGLSVYLSKHMIEDGKSE